LRTHGLQRSTKARNTGEAVVVFATRQQQSLAMERTGWIMAQRWIHVLPAHPGDIKLLHSRTHTRVLMLRGIPYGSKEVSRRMPLATSQRAHCSSDGFAFDDQTHFPSSLM
jgi:hypothetical protein